MGSTRTYCTLPDDYCRFPDCDCDSTAPASGLDADSAGGDTAELGNGPRTDCLGNGKRSPGRIASPTEPPQQSVGVGSKLEGAENRFHRFGSEKLFIGIDWGRRAPWTIEHPIIAEGL